MVNLSYAPIQASGTANVPLSESTGGQLQGAPYNATETVSGVASVLGYGGISGFNIVPGNPGLAQGSGQGGGFDLFSNLITSGVTTINTVGASGGGSALVITGPVAGSGIGGSGYNTNQQAALFSSGFGYTAISTASGAFGPAGFFMLQIMGISGNPFVKVPFFNS